MEIFSVDGLTAGMPMRPTSSLAGMIQAADVMKNRLTDIEIPTNKRIDRETGISMEARWMLYQNPSKEQFLSFAFQLTYN